MNRFFMAIEGVLLMIACDIAMAEFAVFGAIKYMYQSMNILLFLGSQNYRALICL